MSAIIDGVNFIVRAIVCVLCLAIWLVVGFLFWLPLLLRSILNYMFNLVLATFRPSANIGRAEKGLEFAITFYMNGFLRISSTMSNKGAAHGTYDEIRFAHIWAFIREFVYAGIVWFVGLMLSGVITVHPRQLWENARAFVVDYIQ